MVYTQNETIVIPTTELRNFYGFLKYVDIPPTLDILKGINKRKDRKSKLLKMIKDSYNHFSKYDNSEQSFLSFSKRKDLPSVNAGGLYSSTGEVVRDIKDGNSEIEYIAREIDPRRATNATFDTGK